MIVACLRLGGRPAAAPPARTACSSRSWSSRRCTRLRVQRRDDQDLDEHAVRAGGAAAGLPPKRKHATIIVLGYPNIFPTIKSHQQCQIIYGHFGKGYEDSEQDYFNAKAAQLDDLVAAAATRAGFFFISPLNAFIGHAQCDPDPWLNGISIRSDGHITSKASFHPNTKGQREYC